MDDERVGRDARYRYAVTDTATPPASSSSTPRRARSPSTPSGAETVAGEAVFVPTCRGRPRGGRRLAAHDHHPARRQRVAAAGAGRHRRRRAAGGGRDAAARGAVGLPRVRGSRPTSEHGSDDDAGSAERPAPVSPRLMLRGLAWDVGLPLVGYYALHFLGASDWVALLDAILRRGAADRLGRRPGPRLNLFADRHARGVRDRAGPRVRQRRPAVPAAQELVRHRCGRPDVPRDDAVRHPADVRGDRRASRPRRRPSPLAETTTATTRGSGAATG